MKPSAKPKRPSRFPLFAWVRWPCEDLTQHEIISHSICPISGSLVFVLHSESGVLYRYEPDIAFISNTAYRPRDREDFTMWAGAESEC